MEYGLLAAGIGGRDGLAIGQRMVRYTYVVGSDLSALFPFSFSFSFFPHPVGTRSKHRLLQDFRLFASTRSVFPVAQTGESFSMLWCGLVAG